MPSYNLDDLIEFAEQTGLPAVREVARALEALGSTSLEWEEVFGAMEQAKAAVRDLERAAVRLARLEGQSWEEVGAHLGITGAGARKRYDRTDLAEVDTLDELHQAEMAHLHAEMRLATKRARRDLDAADESDDVNWRVLRELGYWERMMAMVSEHSKQRRELVQELEGSSSP